MGIFLSEESCSMGLPLGVEYETKKQRLQQELRMDYRRYMAQVSDLTCFLMCLAVTNKFKVQFSLSSVNILC